MGSGMVKLRFQGVEDSGLGCEWPGSPLEVKTWLMGKGEAGLMETGNFCHPYGWSWYLHVFFQLGALPLDKRNYSNVSHCPHQFKLSGMDGIPSLPPPPPSTQPY